MYKRTFLGLALTILLALVSILPQSTALADEPANTQGFRKAVTVAGISEHLTALQAIADANGGTRLAGTAGYDASAEYVYNRLVTAGYNVEYQEFSFPYVGDRIPPTFQQLSPAAYTYKDGVDYRTLSYSGSGDVTAALATPSGASIGCSAADFAGFPAGSIALIERGACTFRLKAQHALDAGAVAVIVYNNADGVVRGTLQEPLFSIPVIGTTRALGLELRNTASAGQVIVRVKADIISQTMTTRNIIAETPGGDPNRVIVIGAHLDSVSAGPGINDNGSGSAAILEIAEVFAQQNRDPRNKLRFIWFGAEELGLLGSNHYVTNLSEEERNKIQLMLNFDMIGSPNYVRFVYDGNNSSFPVGSGVQPGPVGSGAIEQAFRDYFASQGLPVAPTPFNGRSDYGPFITIAGIPAGGLFTGAEGIKTAEQAAIYGGSAGQPFDVCYHKACDTSTNINEAALDEMSDAAAHVILIFSKHNFEQRPLVDPVTTPEPAPVQGGGGGLHDDHDHDDPEEL